MGRGESKTGGYSSRGAFVTTGVGQGDGLATKLSRRPRKSVGLGGPWRMTADDEFAGTYLSRVNKGFEDSDELEIPMFPEQDPDWMENFLIDPDTEPIRSRKVPRPIKSKGLKEEQRYGDIMSYSLKEAFSNIDKEGAESSKKYGSQYKEWSPEIPEEAEEEEKRHEPGSEYVTAYKTELGTNKSHRRTSVSDLREMIRATIYEIAAKDKALNSDDQDSQDDDGKEVEEVNIVPNIAGVQTPLGTGPSGGKRKPQKR